MGYGLLTEDGNGGPSVVTWGVFTASSRLSLGERLHTMYRELMELTERHAPDEVAVEEPFVSVNARTAMAVGQAQGVALMAAAARGLEAARYSPAQVKLAVTGHGGASKEQVQQAVRMYLGLDAVPGPEDAADALAVAICHLQARRSGALLNP